MDKNLLLSFEARLKMLYNDDIKQEVLNVFKAKYQKILLAEEMPIEEVEKRRHISLIISQVCDGRNTYEFKYGWLNGASIKKPVEFSHLSLDTNVLELVKKIPKETIFRTIEDDEEHLAFQSVEIYSSGIPCQYGYNLPGLTMRDILSQLPEEEVDYTKAVLLEINPEYLQFAFDIVMNRYNFRVALLV